VTERSRRVDERMPARQVQGVLRRQFVAILLAFAIIPSVGRASKPREYQDRVVAQQQGDDQPDSERGCSALFHLCSCHVPPSSTPSPIVRGTVARMRNTAGRAVVQCAAVARSRNADPPPLPPPIA
jgi:hypothetical protein